MNDEMTGQEMEPKKEAATVDAESLAENQGAGWVARSWLPGIAFAVFPTQ